MSIIESATTIYNEMINDVDFSNKLFQKSIFFVCFNPLYWNFGARLEYNTKLLSKLAFGSKTVAVYVFSLSVFVLGLIRDDIYREAIIAQATSPYLDNVYAQIAGLISFSIGSVFVASSMFSLGVVGTYLGDHFGFLMKERITSFPFNVLDNPMYDGSTLCFLGTALWYGKPAGLVISAFVYGMYQLVELIEEPFTAKIYSNKSRQVDSKTD